MQEIRNYDPGFFCWVDLATIGVDAAKKFYRALFPWEMQDVPAGNGMFYTMLNIKGKPVAGLYEMSPEEKQMHLPPHWMSYVSVSNADAALKKAAELGGKVIMPAADVMDEGRMGVFQDSTGAFLAVWQPKKHIGAVYRNTPGALCWNEMGTRDPDTAKAFFTALFKWEPTTAVMGETVYTTFKLAEKEVAGMYVMSANMKDVPPHWLPYFQVENCDATIEKALASGGKVLMPAMDIQGVGRFSVLEDPQGGVFGVIAC